MILVSQPHPLEVVSELIKRIVYRIQVGERAFDIYVQSPSLVEQPGLEAAIPLALLPAMKLRQPIHAEGALSTTFVEGVRRVIDYYVSNFEEFSTVNISADSYYQATQKTSQRKASFFSGGVDSFFTLFKARDELTDIITIRGFDMSLSDNDRWQKTSSTAKIITEELNLQLHEVESNFGLIIKEFGLWVEHGHGMALACIARSFASLFSEIRIPGTHDITHHVPWGSSVITDPQYSDEQLSIIHDACPAKRTDKIIYLSKEPLALNYLRVCPGKKNDGHYNCCRCEKCLRTMVVLYAIGALDNASAFPLQLTPKLVAGAIVPTADVGQMYYVDDNIKLMQRYRPDDKAMLKALHIQRNRPYWVAKILMWSRRKRRHLARKIKKNLQQFQIGTN
jgi:hypothetical protein